MLSSHSFVSIINKARQNRILPSVTYKIRCADFPVRAERVEFSRKSQVCLNIYLARKEGKTDPQTSKACEWVGSPLTRKRKVFCEVNISAFRRDISQNTFIRRLKIYFFAPSLIINCSAVRPDIPPSRLCHIRASRSSAASTLMPSRPAMARTMLRYSFWSGEG